MKKTPLAIVCLLAVAATMSAQTPQDLVSYYDSELMQIHSTWILGTTIQYQEYTAITTFGIPTGLRQSFVEYQDTAKLVRTFSWINTTANVLILGGVGGYVLYFALTRSGDLYWAAPEAFAMILGSIAAVLIGLPLKTFGPPIIVNAVNGYNRHKIEEFAP